MHVAGIIAYVTGWMNMNKQKWQKHVILARVSGADPSFPMQYKAFGGVCLDHDM